MQFGVAGYQAGKAGESEKSRHKKSLLDLSRLLEWY